MSSHNHPPQVPESFNQQLTREVFAEFDIAGPIITPTLATARKIGIFTCADALALGMDHIVERRSRQSFSVKAGQPLFRSAVRSLCGEEIPAGRAQPNDWQWFYRDLRDGTPALLLPAQGEGFQLSEYRDIDIHTQVGRETQRMNIGQLLDSDFREEFALIARERVYAHRYLDREQYYQSLEAIERNTAALARFAEEVAAPAVAAFDRTTGNSPA